MKKLSSDYTVDNVAPKIFADSGAYSAWTQGVEIKIDDYAEWLHQWRDFLSVYVNLDVVENPRATEKNQRALESMGLKPLPVWHIRSDEKEFQKLCEEYSYIGIGGMVGTPWKRVMPTLISIMKYAATKNVAVHGLGLTSLEPISKLPFYSVDSTSWLSGGRFGQVPLWDNKNKKYQTISLGDKAKWLRFKDVAKETGINPARYIQREATTQELAWCGVVAYQAMQKTIQKKFGPIKIDTSKEKPDCDKNDGLLIYLVIAPPVGNLGKVIQNYKDNHSCEISGCKRLKKNHTDGQDIPIYKCENKFREGSYYRKEKVK